MYRLLIVDNQPEWRKFSQQVLSERGYDIVLAKTVENLTALLKENRYDLILVSAELMRDEFREAIHCLFHENPDKAIIVVSVPSLSHQDVQETRTAFKLGAKDCVDKPFSPERLLTLVRQLLEEFVGQQTKRQGVQP